jgi:hypothetical protein
MNRKSQSLAVALFAAGWVLLAGPARLLPAQGRGMSLGRSIPSWRGGTGRPTSTLSRLPARADDRSATGTIRSAAPATLKLGGNKSAVSVAVGAGGVGVAVGTDDTAVAVAVGQGGVGVGVAKDNGKAVSVGAGHEGVSVGVARGSPNNQPSAAAPSAGSGAASTLARPIPDKSLPLRSSSDSTPGWGKAGVPVRSAYWTYDRMQNQ